MYWLDVHSHTQHSTAHTLVIRNQYPLTADTSEPFSVGIHPWYTDNWEAQWQALLPIAQHPNCWAIGECGLDRNTATPLALQQQIFLLHIQLSEQLQLPLIIHCVKAYAEIIALRKQTKAQQLWVLHGFRKNLQVAQSLIAQGIALSFGAALQYDTRLQEVYKALPREYCFLESDDSKVQVCTLVRQTHLFSHELHELTRK